MHFKPNFISIYFDVGKLSLKFGRLSDINYTMELMQ